MQAVLQFIDRFSVKQLFLFNVIVAFVCLLTYGVFVSNRPTDVEPLEEVDQPKTSLVSRVVSKVNVPFITQPTPEPSATPEPTPPPTPVPIKIEIPKIKVDTNVIQLGYIKETNEMEVPANANDVGWYKYGTPPGENGTSVLNAHFDTPTGKRAIFYDLTKVTEGDEFYVTNDQGKRMKYIVKEVINAPLSEFPKEKIYGPRTFSQVTLMTCSGVWNPQTQLYSNRLAVIGSLQETTDMPAMVAANQSAGQFLVQPFNTESKERVSGVSGVYIRLDVNENLIKVYLATDSNDVVASDIYIKYDPIALSINKDDITLSDDFEAYSVDEMQNGVIQLSLFTDPERKAKQAFNSVDNEIKVAEMSYTKKTDTASFVNIIWDGSQTSSVVLKPVEGKDIHQGINILNYVQGATVE